MPDGDFKLVYYESPALTAELQARLKFEKEKCFRDGVEPFRKVTSR